MSSGTSTDTFQPWQLFTLAGLIGATVVVFVSEGQTPAGAVPALLPPGAADQTQVRMNAIPAVGQHSDAILRELGLSAAQIAQLKTDQAI